MKFPPVAGRLEQWGPHQNSDDHVYACLARSRAIFYTPTTTNTVRQLDRDLDQLLARVERCIDDHVHRDHVGLRPGHRPHYVDLLVIDEADRLAPQSLEHLRDRFDRRPSGCCSSACPGSTSGCPGTPSCTAASASPTSTGRSATTSSRSS